MLPNISVLIWCWYVAVVSQIESDSQEDDGQEESDFVWRILLLFSLLSQISQEWTQRTIFLVSWWSLLWGQDSLFQRVQILSGAFPGAGFFPLRAGLDLWLMSFSDSSIMLSHEWKLLVSNQLNCAL
jgi:hypothetical protein